MYVFIAAFLLYNFDAGPFWWTVFIGIMLVEVFASME